MPAKRQQQQQSHHLQADLSTCSLLCGLRLWHGALKIRKNSAVAAFWRHAATKF